MYFIPDPKIEELRWKKRRLEEQLERRRLEDEIAELERQLTRPGTWRFIHVDVGVTSDAHAGYDK